MRNVMDRKIKLKHVNEHITCILCKGYFIDATTITECLHTFCKSCIVLHLREHTTCPTCKQVIHQSHPLNYISHDRTMQDIVFKLVPDLQKDETTRVHDYYKKEGLEVPKIPYGLLSNNSSSGGGGDDNADDKNGSGGGGAGGGDKHRSDEQVNVSLECGTPTTLRSLKRKYIRCSTQATITHLKKYLALKLYKDKDKYKEMEILCNEELLGKDHTLKFICLTRWRVKDKPLALTYRPKSL